MAGSLAFAEFPAVRVAAACDEIAVEAGVWWLQPVAASASVGANTANASAVIRFIMCFVTGCSHSSADATHLQTAQQAGLGPGPKPGEITSTMKVYRHFGEQAPATATSQLTSPANLK
jgi:hypothetical protein